MSSVRGFSPDYGVSRVCGLVGLGEGLLASAPHELELGLGPGSGGQGPGGTGAWA